LFNGSGLVGVPQPVFSHAAAFLFGNATRMGLITLILTKITLVEVFTLLSKPLQEKRV
jgi:hypothetical protein